MKTISINLKVFFKFSDFISHRFFLCVLLLLLVVVVCVCVFNYKCIDIYIVLVKSSWSVYIHYEEWDIVFASNANATIVFYWGFIVCYQFSFVLFCFPVWKIGGTMILGNILQNIMTDSGFSWPTISNFGCSLCIRFLFRNLIFRYVKASSLCLDMEDILRLLNVRTSSGSSCTCVWYWIRNLDSPPPPKKQNKTYCEIFTSWHVVEIYKGLK